MPATNDWNSAPSETGIPRKAVAVTPSDSSDLARVARRLHIGGAGNVQVTLDGMTDGTFVIYRGLQAGQQITGFFKRIWSTGTTATFILAEE